MKLALAISLVLGSSLAQSQIVNWPDTRGFLKPAPVTILMPNEATATKYYVNYSSGSGSTCSQAAPCANLQALSGKTSMNGGPAYVYVKGNGYLSLTSGTIAGSSGNEIVIKPWPGDSTPTVLTAQSGCGRLNANSITGSGIHHLIFDGGPDMLITFKGSGCTTDQNGYAMVVSSDDITLFRVQLDGNNSSGPVLGPAVGSGADTQNFRMINSYMFNASRYYGVYGGGGTSCGAGDTRFDNMQFLNNQFRNIDGRGIQIEPRANSDGLIVAYNFFDHIGYDTSGNNAGPSATVQPAGSCGGVTAHIKVYGNVATDLGGGFDRVDYSGSPTCADYEIYNNTVLTYGMSSRTANKSSHGIGVDTAGECATVKNNIFIDNHAAGQGVGPIDPTRGGSLVTSKNLCDAGNCGSSAITATATATFVSTSISSRNFLQLKTGSTAINAGATIPFTMLDYAGKVRTIGGTIDIGAHEFGTGSTSARPKPPTSH